MPGCMNVVCTAYMHSHTCRHVLNTHIRQEKWEVNDLWVYYYNSWLTPSAQREASEACDSVTMRVLTAISTSIKISCWIRFMHTYWCIKSRVKWVGPKNMHRVQQTDRRSTRKSQNGDYWEHTTHLFATPRKKAVTLRLKSDLDSGGRLNGFNRDYKVLLSIKAFLNNERKS